jgi:lysophospholipase L1-like esterase
MPRIAVMDYMLRSTIWGAALLVAALPASALFISDDLWSAPYLHNHDVILFQGDSITEGGRWRTGRDFNHIMGQDYAYILAAQLGAAHPERQLTFLNRGISGNRILDLAARWQTDTLDLKPDFLSILVGINDTLASGDQAESLEHYQQTYDKLLAATIAALPQTKVLLGEPFLLPVGRHRASYASEIIEVERRQNVVRSLGAKYHLPVALYQSAFDRACQQAPPPYWSWDGVHPTYAGHALIVREWLRVARAFWPGD